MFFSLNKLIQSLKFAISGIKIVIVKQQTFRIMALIAVLVIGAAFLFDLSIIEKSIIFLVIALTLSAELFNSIIEEMINFIYPEPDYRVKRIKDGLAGTVLIMVLLSIVIGILIFLPHFLKVV